MRIESEYDREERRARAGMVAGIGLAIAGVALALLVRYQPELASAIVPGGSGLAPPSRDVESATIAQSAGAVTLPAPSEAPPSRDTVSIPLLALLQDTGSRPPRGRRTVVTDVVLLPCSTPNPRADGSFLIPPHNPRHRTIVGLPHQPGESARGFVIPPLDPKRENQVPIQIIPIDSILAHTLRVPPPRSHRLQPGAAGLDGLPARLGRRIATSPLRA